MNRVRRKRASDIDLYKACKAGADCIPDVKNKIEGKTWADTLLQIFGSLVYFGNLGIGTGRGTGGTGGYRPIGAQTPTRGTTGPAPRPSIPSVDVIGPAEILPVGPDAPAIVPLQEGIPETGIIDTPGPGPALESDSVDITTIIDPVSEVEGVGEHPNIIGGSSDVAQIDVQLAPPPPKKVALDPSVTQNISVIQVRQSHLDPNVNVFVNPSFDGVNIGTPENIELTELNLREEFEIDEGPLRSTPLSSRVITRARDFYNRFVQQVPTSQQQLIGENIRASTSEFENPAFTDDISSLFKQDIQEVATSSNLKYLSDIQLTETPQRTIRFSRLAQKPGMTTRSGLEIGQRVHLYFDLSPIAPESIEMAPLGEFSHESTWVDGLATSSFINPFENAINGFSDDMLLDTLDEDFSSSHLLLTATSTGDDNIEIPSLPPGIGLNVYANTLNSSIFVNHAAIDTTDVIVPDSPFTPLQPAYEADVVFETFDLHPSLRRRKRKRSSF